MSGTEGANNKSSFFSRNLSKIKGREGQSSLEFEDQETGPVSEETKRKALTARDFIEHMYKKGAAELSDRANRRQAIEKQVLFSSIF